MDKKNLSIRLMSYLGGFLIMTLGVALSIKSNLGVSPVSSIPYTMTCVWQIEMGKATIYFHVVLVLLQVIILRKEFEVKNLLQIPIGVVFGYFTTSCNHFVGLIPIPLNIGVRVLMIVVSTLLVAFGIFMYVPAQIMPLAGEGVMLAVAKVTGKPFAIVKMFFDISMVIISLSVCLIAIHSLGSVGIGTIIAAILVGTELKFITQFFGKYRDAILNDAYGNNEEAGIG